MGRLDSKELDPAENQTTVGATETEVVFQCVVNFDVASGIGTVVQIAFGILVVQVDGGGHFLMVQGEHSENTLNATRATQQVTCHGFCGADQGFLGMIAQGRLDGIGFVDVAQRRRSAVRIQVIHLISIDAGIAHG